MIDNIAVENPKFAHVSRPPHEPIWWRCWRRTASHGLNVVAVQSCTWFVARAVGRVLLATEEIEVDRLVGADAEGAKQLRVPIFIGPRDTPFFDLGGAAPIDVTPFVDAALISVVDDSPLTFDGSIVTWQ